MSISDIGSNLLIGIISGIISSIIVTRTSMVIQSYLDEFREIRIVVLKIYRVDIYLRIIISQASKYISYEENHNIRIREIADFSKEAKFINKIYEEIREESLFSQFSYKSLDEYRDKIKCVFKNNIDDIEMCNVSELGDLISGTSSLCDEYNRINKSKTNVILKIIVKDIVTWIILVSAIAVSLILIA